MTLELGTTKEEAEEIMAVSSGFVKNCKEKGRYRFRILTSFYKIAELFYPTIRVDEESQELKPSWNRIQVPYDSKHLLSPLIDADRRIKIQHAHNRGLEENVRSTIEPSIGYMCLIFDRDEDLLRIDMANLKKSIVKQIIDLERKPSPGADASKLWHGPAFCWDAIIEHKYDAGKGGAEWQKHSYDVEVDTSTNKFENKIPVEIWKSELSPMKYLEEKLKGKNINAKEYIFTAEEIRLMDTYEGNIREEAKPLADNEIMEELKKFPINSMGVDKSGNYVFVDPKGIWEELNRLSLPASSEEDMKKLGNGSNIDEDVDIDFSSNTEDIVIEETEVTKEAVKAERPDFTNI